MIVWDMTEYTNLVIDCFIMLRQCLNPNSVKYGIWLMYGLSPLFMLSCLQWQISPEGLGMLYLLVSFMMYHTWH